MIRCWKRSLLERNRAYRPRVNTSPTFAIGVKVPIFLPIERREIDAPRKIDSRGIGDFFQGILQSIENRGEKAGPELRFEQMACEMNWGIQLDAARVFENLDLRFVAGDLDHFG